MNRKQRIIVSITGIFLVLLTLVGLTYAYFLTKIKGNDNEKSISVTTANLELVYGDGTQTILKNDIALEPDSDNAIGTKDFTVTNKGNDTSYVVVIEDVSITNASDGSTTTFNSNDFRYTLTCTKKDGTSCDGVTTQTLFPLSGGILVGNSIKEGDVHTYVLTMWYIETGIDQSKDMGKTLQAKVNITNIQEIENPYSSNKNSLAYNIIENAKNKANGTELLSSPKTQVAVVSSFISTKGTHIAGPGDGFYGWDGLTYGDTQGEANGGTNTVSGADNVAKCNSVKGKHISDASSCYSKCSYIGIVEDCTTDGTPMLTGSSENTMSVATDDYGTSYYYRGNVIDNYVNFAGMCWRAVRIAGDGSVKLILEDQDETCSKTMNGNWNIPTTTGGTTKNGNFGYTQYASNTLTASDGTKNSSAKYLMNYLNGGTSNDYSMATAFKNFQTGPLANYLDKLKTGDWCLNDKAYATESDNTTALTSQEMLDKQVKNTSFYYDTYVRLNGKTTKEPTLKCNGTVMTKFADENNTDMYVGTLTADEIVYAGGKVGTSNPDYYLINDYQKSNSLFFWSLSPSNFSGGGVSDGAFRVSGHGSLSDFSVGNSSSFRPAVSLKSSTQITGGNGTKANAYTIG